jgi:3-hydroxyacyl-[acyl-carrier-protein] dehydratase
MRQAVEIRFAEDHPTAEGHFPGNPILPGALLVDAVLLAVSDERGAPSCKVRTVKFLRPVRPGDDLRIEWEVKDGETHFSCVLPASGEIAVSGILRLGDESR